ncbi:MAG TPA: hypothetical protein VF944_12235 [Candidatus Bathyarchaeia archaeon]
MAIKVAIDQGAKQNLLRPLQRQGLIELRQANELEQHPFRGVIQQKKGFMLGSTKLGGPDELAKAEVVEKLQEIIGLANSKDIGHMYAAYLNKCEYFVTDNPRRLHQGWSQRGTRIPTRCEDPAHGGIHSGNHYWGRAHARLKVKAIW